jgi:hypothetical protein
MNTHPGEAPVNSRDCLALGDIAHAKNKAAISASQRASAAPIARVLATRNPAIPSAPIA